MGAFRLVREAFPGLSIHTSTQMTVTNRYGAMMMKELGADRVVTAREMSFAEIRDIKDHVDIEIESFVHGALCYCYSGQCLFSSMLGGRSGNRYHTGCIFGLFHSSLNFKGIHSIFDQFRDH